MGSLPRVPCLCHGQKPNPKTQEHPSTLIFISPGVAPSSGLNSPFRLRGICFSGHIGQVMHGRGFSRGAGFCVGFVFVQTNPHGAMRRGTHQDALKEGVLLGRELLLFRIHGSLRAGSRVGALRRPSPPQLA